jgi:hypothetical protein
VADAVRMCWVVQYPDGFGLWANLREVPTRQAGRDWIRAHPGAVYRTHRVTASWEDAATSTARRRAASEHFAALGRAAPVVGPDTTP